MDNNNNKEDQKPIIKEVVTKNRRWKYLLGSTLLATGAWILSLFGVIDQANAVSFNEWVEFVKYAFGMFALSEVGAKGANAYLNK